MLSDLFHLSSTSSFDVLLYISALNLQEQEHQHIWKLLMDFERNIGVVFRSLPVLLPILPANMIRILYLKCKSLVRGAPLSSEYYLGLFYAELSNDQYYLLFGSRKPLKLPVDQLYKFDGLSELISNSDDVSLDVLTQLNIILEKDLISCIMKVRCCLYEGHQNYSQTYLFRSSK